MAIIFDGKAYALRKEEELKKKVIELRKKGIVPKLVSIIVGKDPASLLYVNLKKKAAERIGAEVETVRLCPGIRAEEIMQIIKRFNDDGKVRGIMVQLPLPDPISNFKSQIINSINPKKDIDGLGENSFYVHPTAKAVLQIIEVAEKMLARHPKTITVIGERGMVGGFLVKEIAKTKLQLIKETKNADIVVGATGKTGIIKKEMVKEGVIIIDVGSPFGDVDPSVALRASFMTPVPGGVGPVTIYCLLENLVVAS